MNAMYTGGMGCVEVREERPLGKVVCNSPATGGIIYPHRLTKSRGMNIGNLSSRFVLGCLKGNITAIKWSGLHRWVRTKHTHCRSHHVRYENGNIREGAVKRNYKGGVGGRKRKAPPRTGGAFRGSREPYLFAASSMATATATVMPTMGLLPAPMRPIISTCAGTEEEPAN